MSTLAGAAITRLVLTQFRNHARLELETEGLPVCLAGPNGAGKTNILEAVSLLGPGRGLRGADLPDMARGGPDGGPFAISALFAAAGEERRLGVGLEAGVSGARRVARIDGRDAGPKEMAETVRLLWLTPAHDRLFAGPAGERRKFLDRLAFAIAPEHGALSGTYERALRERQKLLEDVRPDQRWLSVLEAEAAGAGTALAAARVEAIDALQAEIDARPEGPFPKAGLALSGSLEAELAAGRPAGEVESGFAATLRDARARDAAAGRALDGPHRSDLLATHLGNGMAAGQCSTGEQKALVLGLVLAQARRIANGLPTAENTGFSGPNPLVLLDEAAAHLDPARRAGLCAELGALPGQSWLTGTDSGLFEAFGAAAAHFEIGPGQARRLS